MTTDDVHAVAVVAVDAQAKGDARDGDIQPAAARRPPALRVPTPKYDNTMSPIGPLSSRRSTSSDSADDTTIDFDDDDEGPMKSCILRLLDGDNVARAVVARTRRRDVALRRRFKGETFVVARAHTKYERKKCCAARTYQMHVLRSSGTCEETSRYAAAQACEDDVAEVNSDPGTMEYFVEVDDPFDTKVYGVMRFVRRDVDALLRTRFDVPTRESILGVDFVVDRFFATTAANEIAGEPDGATFIRTLMLDATRKEAWRMSPCRAVPILSAVPIDVEGVKVFAHSARDVAVVECDGVACDADVMAEREDWVTRKFLTLYVVPASAPNEAKNALSPGKKTWLAFAEARGETLRDDATNDDAPMILTLHACARQKIEYNESIRLSCMYIIAEACGETLSDEESAGAVVDALGCALRDDSGKISHTLEFERNVSRDFVDAVEFVRGEDASSTKRAVVCLRTACDDADIFMESLESSMRDAETDACVLVARCSTYGDHLTLCDGDVLLSEALARAASRGLFVDGGVFKAFVREDACIITARFARREFRVRPSTLKDVDALVAIEAEAWVETPEMRTSPETVRERVQNNASMNFVVEDIKSGDVRGVMYTQYVESVDAPLDATWETKESNRREPKSTDVVQLLDVFVDQAYGARCASDSGASVGQELRNYVLHYAEQTGLRYACAVTRTRGFRSTQALNPNLTYEAYVHGDALDRGVFFHTSAGAEIVRVVRPWRARDYENEGAGVLIRYDVREYAFAAAARRGRTSRVRRRPSDPTVREGREYVNALESVAWEARARAFPVE